MQRHSNIHLLQSSYTADTISSIAEFATNNFMLCKMQDGAGIIVLKSDLGTQADPAADVEGWDVQAR
jgi:homoserine dehydrogenase